MLDVIKNCCSHHFESFSLQAGNLKLWSRFGEKNVTCTWKSTKHECFYIFIFHYTNWLGRFKGHIFFVERCNNNKNNRLPGAVVTFLICRVWYDKAYPDLHKWNRNMFIAIKAQSFTFASTNCSLVWLFSFRELVLRLQGWKRHALIWIQWFFSNMLTLRSLLLNSFSKIIFWTALAFSSILNIVVQIVFLGAMFTNGYDSENGRTFYFDWYFHGKCA